MTGLKTHLLNKARRAQGELALPLAVGPWAWGGAAAPQAAQVARRRGSSLHPQHSLLFPHLFSPPPRRWTSSKDSSLPAATRKPDSLPGEYGLGGGDSREGLAARIPALRVVSKGLGPEWEKGNRFHLTSTSSRCLPGGGA